MRKEWALKFTLFPAGMLNWAGDFFSVPNKIGELREMNRGPNYRWYNSMKNNVLTQGIHLMYCPLLIIQLAAE